MSKTTNSNEHDEVLLDETRSPVGEMELDAGFLHVATVGRSTGLEGVDLPMVPLASSSFTSSTAPQTELPD